MKRLCCILLFLLFCKNVFFADTAPKKYLNPRLPVTERVKDLLARMTLQEKVAQLNLMLYRTDRDSLVRDAIRKNKVGAILKACGVELNTSLQKEALEHSRLKIPMIFHEDIVYGYRTIFPIPLAESCTWDTILIKKNASAAAKEAAAAGINLTYSPMVDISNDPRWGRIMETSGEDAFLGAAMAKARVLGYQGSCLNDKLSLAACVKHFIGYGALNAGRDYENTDFSYRDLVERYLPPFKAAIEAGVSSVMCSYTSYDGEPVTVNRFLNTDILRNKLDFKGMLVTDWATLNHAVEEGAAENGKDATERGIQSGIDMDMVSGQFLNNLEKLVQEGKIDLELIDQAVSRVLTLKFQLGLFDNPFLYLDKKRERTIVGSSAIRNTAFEAACASMVLLKNEKNVLPVQRDSKIALIGPFASIKEDLLGPKPWRENTNSEDVISVKDGLYASIGENHLIDLSCEWNGITEDYINSVINRVRDVETIVVCLGEFIFSIGESTTSGHIELPQDQIRLLKEIRKLGKPTAVVLFNGRPLVLNEVLENCDALLEAWYPGTMGGKAVAALLLGERIPSGKLTQSFPRKVGQIPIAYNPRRTFWRIHHDGIPNGPQFPFGYGLSYTKFKYSGVMTDKKVYNEGDSVLVTFTVTNTGDYDGREVVQLYVRDRASSIIPREKELKGFVVASIKRGETKKIVFSIPTEAFKVYNNQMDFILEPGTFDVMVGPNSEQVKSVTVKFE